MSTRFSLSMEMSRLTRDGMVAEPVSRDQILRRERGHREIFIFSVQLTSRRILADLPGRSTLLLYVCDHTLHAPRRHTQLPNNCVLCVLFGFYFSPFFCFLGDDAFSEYLCTINIAVFSPLLIISMFCL